MFSMKCLFTFLSGAPVHQTDYNRLSGAVTDVEAYEVASSTIPPLISSRISFYPFI